MVLCSSLCITAPPDGQDREQQWCPQLVPHCGEGESTSLTLGTRQLSFLQTDAQAYLPSDNLKHLGNIAVCSLGSGASEPEARRDCRGGQGAVWSLLFIALVWFAFSSLPLAEDD